MQAKEILKELIKYDTFNDRENHEIINYIQGILEEKGRYGFRVFMSSPPF